MYLTATNFDQHFSDLSDDSVQLKLTCLNIAQAIEKRETTLISFVEAAGPYLINKDHEKRQKGVAILATILDYLPRDVVILDSKQMEYLCAFLVDRLKDHHAVIPAVLKSICALISFKNFPHGVIQAFLNGIFQNVSCQTQQPKERLILYKIFAELVQNYRKEVSEMGPDFVYGVLSSVENERNPENLLYLFNWYPKFCTNINLRHLTDEMFDILSGYFPVDYQPLNNQPNEISRDELAEALSNGLYAIPEFGDQCIFLALEKLSSDLLVAKFDSLKLLMHGTSNFTSEAYFAHSTDILSSIKRQIFETDNNELKTLCSDTLTAISLKLSNSELSKYNDILTVTYDMVQENLSPCDKYFAASNLFLTGFSKGSQKAAEFMTQKITKEFILINTTDLKFKVDILRTVYLYTKILIKFDDRINQELLEEIQNFFYNAATNTENEIIQTEGFFCLGLIASYLTTDNKNKILDILKIELVKQNLEENCYKKAIRQCFENFANAYPEEINILIQVNGQKNKNCDELAVYLEMIGSLVKLEKFTKIIMDIIINLCSSKNVEFAMVALKELRKILIDAKCQNRIITHLIHQRFAYKIILWLLSIINEIELPKHKPFLINLSFVVQTIIGHDSIENQLILVDELLPRILSVQEDVSIVLISSLLTKLKSNFDLNHEHVSFFISKCFNATEDPYLLNIAQELVANLMNKCKNDTKIDDHLKYITQMSEIFASNTEVTRNYNYKFVPLITKSLIMKGHPQSTMWINQMIDLLNTSDEIVNGFSVVLSDNIDSLSDSSHCAIRLFYKQRFFSEVSTILSSNSNNENYFKAYCIMLKNISSKIFASEFQKNLPLVLASLKECKDIDALNALLKMLESAINEKNEVITDNIDEILTELLKLFTFKNSMEIRILSIKCVEGFLIGYPVEELSKQKCAILTALTLCIDDKKRFVRKVAANSINKWFLCGEDY